MNALAQLVDGTALNAWVNAEVWLWPLLEIIHFLGLSLLLGAMLVVDLRLAGFMRVLSLRTVHTLLPLAGFGFAMNLFSGALFFVGDPHRYAANIGFRWKMVLIAAAGLNALWHAWKIAPAAKTWPAHGDTSNLAKSIAYVSLVLWLGVLLLGRLIPYLGAGEPLVLVQTHLGLFAGVKNGLE